MILLFLNCNDFLAGNMLHSAKRYKALDEAAIFGMCCRHEFPKMFLDLKHGERFSYDNYCSKLNSAL